MRGRRNGNRYIYWLLVGFGVALLGFAFFSIKFLLVLAAVGMIFFGIWLMRC